MPEKAEALSEILVQFCRDLSYIYHAQVHERQ